MRYLFTENVKIIYAVLKLKMKWFFWVIAGMEFLQKIKIIKNIKHSSLY